MRGDQNGHRRSNSHTSGCVTSSVKKQDVNAHSYHVELSNTLYGGDLKTPDTPGLMTQSMDPSLLAALSNFEVGQGGFPISSSKGAPMSQSLDPEHMSVSLKNEQVSLFDVVI